MEIKFTPISNLGEFGLIRRIRNIAARVENSHVIHSIGDDSAVLRTSHNSMEIVTADLMLQGVHFDLSYTSMRHLGRKAAAVNLSDIAAMSGVPVAATVSLGLHSNISVEMVDEFYESLVEEFGRYNCAVVGGDISASVIGMVIGITLLGEVEPERYVLRRGAKPGDVVCISGDLGRAQAGLKILNREKARYVQLGEPSDFSPNFDGYDDALEKHLLPEPRVEMSRKITEKIKVNSMIDVSDGLASDMLHICESSGVAAELDEELIPIDPLTRRIAREFGDDPLNYALYGGEDYELLFTISEKNFSALFNLEGNIRVIGRIFEGNPEVRVKRISGSTLTLVDFPSYQHFSPLPDKR
ncbi:MAG: thiamine-phosphate kinase [Candidatus Kryptoniota bacterium]